jgi:hypothetical protein
LIESRRQMFAIANLGSIIISFVIVLRFKTEKGGTNS